MFYKFHPYLFDLYYYFSYQIDLKTNYMLLKSRKLQTNQKFKKALIKLKGD